MNQVLCLRSVGRARVLGLLLMVLLPEYVVAEPLLLLQGDRLSQICFGDPIALADGRTVQAERMVFACEVVHSAPDEILVFAPDDGACHTYSRFSSDTLIDLFNAYLDRTRTFGTLEELAQALIEDDANSLVLFESELGRVSRLPLAACEPDLPEVIDSDGDGVADGADNCPATPNPDQSDNDGDAIGDACDADDDNDGVADEVDNCPFDANTDQGDLDGDGTGSACDDVEIVNEPPVADDDMYVTDEDVALSIGAPGVLDGDSDESPSTLSVTGHGQPANGSVTVNPDGSFIYTPDLHWYGSDAFDYIVSDEEGLTDTATVTVNVRPVNDAPRVSVSRSSETLQYSDGIGTVIFTATDVDDASLTHTARWTDDDGATSYDGLPSNLTLTPGDPPCVPQSHDYSPATGSTCTWTLEGPFDQVAGTYDVLLEASDGDLTGSGQTRLVVAEEQALVSLSADNPVSIDVTGDGGDSVQFELVFTAKEWVPDSAAHLAAAGDITRATPDLKLSPVGPGSVVSPLAPCAVSSNGGTGYEEALTFTCAFGEVPVNTYSVEAALVGGYYAGSDDDVLTVADPSLGYSSGGGWFYWPATGDKTNFGYTMKYNKKRTNIQGSFLLIRHIADAPDGEDKWRVKSNAVEGLALGEENDFGWASFTTRATYKAPGADTEGNHETTVYVEDYGEPGAGVDRLWLQVRDRDDAVVGDLSLEAPGAENAMSLEGGNIVVPRKGRGRGKRN